MAHQRDARHAARTALLPAARLHRAARRLPPSGRARAGAAPLRLVQGRAACRTTARKASTRATSRDKPRFIREAPHLTPNDKHTYRVYYAEAARVAALGRRRGEADRRHAGRSMDRLRNTYIIFTSDNGFFFGEHRLIGGKFLAYEPATHLPFLIRGPGIKPGHLDRRAGGEHRHRADDPRTGRRRSATRASTAARWSPSCATPTCARRRPILFESFVETSDVEAAGRDLDRDGAGRRDGARRTQRRDAPRSSRRPRTTRGSASAPTSTSPGRPARRSSTTSTKTRTSSTTSSRCRNFFPIRNFLHRQLRALEDCVGRDCREPAPQMPLTRKELQRQRKRRRKNATQRKGTAERSPLKVDGPLRRALGDGANSTSRGRWHPGPYSMTASTSPLETAAPSETFSAVDLAGAVGGDLVLHLHRLDHADQVALLDLRRPSRPRP